MAKHELVGDYTNQFDQRTLVCSCGDAFDPPFSAHIQYRAQQLKREQAEAAAIEQAAKDLEAAEKPRTRGQESTSTPAE